MQVNDIHSELNATEIAKIVTPQSVGEIQQALAWAEAHQVSVSVSGARHAMGGQQFVTDGLLLDMRQFNRVVHFDKENGWIEVEAGIQWPDLLTYLYDNQAPTTDAWAFRQKQTGADLLTVGGCLSANIHGRGLAMRPFIDDIECFTLLTDQNEIRQVSRTENSQLFRLAIGGYGLFGVVLHVTLRLSRRAVVRRDISIAKLRDVPQLFVDRQRDGYLYGDFQYSIDWKSDTYLSEGVFACYKATYDQTLEGSPQKELVKQDWIDLLALAHLDPASAYEKYAQYYLSTQGQCYWSDSHQMSIYPEQYHHALDPLLGHKGSEMITEIYVPLGQLIDFFDAVKSNFLRQQTQVVYGTVRLIQQDTESYLAWAKADYACIIFNLHVEHSVEGLSKAQAAFTNLIDIAQAMGGSYFLTYHRWATKEQVLAAYPQMPEFLKLKLAHDPNERFQSNWYRHYKAMFL